MTSDRFQQLEDLFESALEREPSQRAAFLDQACGGDPSLRRQLEALIASHEEAPSFLESPSRRVTAFLTEHESDFMVGQRIGPYEVLHEIGRGGMGEVYLAQDKRLGRHVALKFLPTSFQEDSDRRARLLTEARAASSLHSPHIAAIYDIGEHEGRAFIVMEYVEGEPLSEKLKGGPMAIEQAIDITMHVAEALEEAHEKGVIHRDIKSSNLMVTPRRQVKVLDFGLAKVAQRLGADTTNEESRLTALQETAPGMVMGTVHYMSPEQARGLAVDARTDLFSLGVVFYKMVTGRLPFEGETSSDVLAAILKHEPEPLALHRPEVPAGLDQVMKKCLEKDRQRRYQSASELREAVERLRHDVLTVSWKTSVLAAKAEASVAVLPFTNMSADPENEFFADGITEEIINALTQIENLHVAARTSAFSFKGKHVDLRIVGERLNVKTVLEGSVRRAGNRVRIMAQLINVADGYHLWSERYDRELKDIFEVQDDISRAIADRLKVSLDRGRQAALKPGTSNLEAYQLYLKGRALLYRRGTDILRAAKCFERAVGLDAHYALAWSGLADARNMIGLYGLERPETTMPQAKEAATRAIALDPALAEAHCSLACVSMLHDWEWNKAEAEFCRARELNPRYLQNLDWYAVFYLVWSQGRFEEGIAVARQAVEYDPLSGYAHGVVAFACGDSGRGEQAVRAAKSATELQESFFTYWASQHAFHSDRQFEKARAAGEMALALSGRHPFAMSAQAIIFADWGKTSAAQAIYAELAARAAQEYVPPTQLAMAASAAGESEKAIAHARLAFEIRDPFLALANHWPHFTRLREEPNIREILVRMGLS
jgi:serine/threonine protein kinase/tetratricopeptide (TPR) repeat protein